MEEMKRGGKRGGKEEEMRKKDELSKSFAYQSLLNTRKLLI